MATVMDQAAGYFIAPRLQFHNVLDELVYYYLLARANYRPNESCQRGQTIVSQTKIAQEIGIHRLTIVRSFERLRKQRLIDYKKLPSGNGLLVTLVDYDEIQNISRSREQQMNNKRTTNKQPMNMKQSANEQPIEQHIVPEIPCESRAHGFDGLINEHADEQQTNNLRTTNKQQANNLRTTSEHTRTKNKKQKTKEENKLPNRDGAEHVEDHNHSTLDGTIPAKDYWKDREYIVDLVQTYRQMPKVTPQKDDYAFFGGLYKQYGYDAVIEAIERLEMMRRVVIIHDPRAYIKGVLNKQSFERPKSWSELTLEQKRTIFQNRIGFQDVMSQ